MVKTRLKLIMMDEISSMVIEFDGEMILGMSWEEMKSIEENRKYSKDRGDSRCSNKSWYYDFLSSLTMD